ncbi:hypothetical protein SEA_ZIMMER_61 [Mycobacterium phage Zimmer]|nr:hypothetical protein SEA_ZIMMER_61 [Mycobacterium phage Zimmer]
MTVSLKVFGFEIARIDLDLGEEAEAVTPVDRGIKKMSHWWMRGMTR